MDPKELRGLMEAYSEVYAPIDEAVKGESSERRRDLASQRRAGDKPLSPAKGRDNANKMQRDINYFDKLTKKNKNVVGLVSNEEVEQIDELSVNKMNAYINKAEKDRGRLNKKWDQGTATSKERKKVFDREEGEARASKKIIQKTGKDSFRLNALDKLKSAITKEDFDIFDTVLEFLYVEGYAETLEEAEWLMANVIDEEAIDIILDEAESIMSNEGYKSFPHGKVEAKAKRLEVDSGKNEPLTGKSDGEVDSILARKKKSGERATSLNLASRTAHSYLPQKKAERNRSRTGVSEAQEARNNPEKYEREQSKKSAPVRGERTPMPPRGDKRREDFEKWYAANGPK
jgi:hypothetical protein